MFQKRNVTKTISCLKSLIGHTNKSIEYKIWVCILGFGNRWHLQKSSRWRYIGIARVIKQTRAITMEEGPAILKEEEEQQSYFNTQDTGSGAIVFTTSSAVSSPRIYCQRQRTSKQQQPREVPMNRMDKVKQLLAIHNQENTNRLGDNK